jgi:predicted Zn finger-like uncharacterized protein
MDYDNKKLSLFLTLHTKCHGTFKITHDKIGNVKVRCMECNDVENITIKEEKIWE